MGGDAMDKKQILEQKIVNFSENVKIPVKIAASSSDTLNARSAFSGR